MVIVVGFKGNGGGVGGLVCISIIANILANIANILTNNKLTH